MTQKKPYRIRVNLIFKKIATAKVGNDLNKEKILEIAREKSKNIKEKCQELIDLAIDKGTPVLKNTAVEVRDKTVEVMNDMIKKLEEVDKESEEK